MEHKPLIERLWGIARTHSFAAFESRLHEAGPDGSLKALTGALRHLASAGQDALAQELLTESLENHVASPQILWRLEMVLLLGQPGTGKDADGVQDLATLESRVKELVQANRLDDAIGQVSRAAQASAAPELYELLGRLHLRRSATLPAAGPAVAAVQPEAAAPAAQPPQATATPADAAPAAMKPGSPSQSQDAAARAETRSPLEKPSRWRKPRVRQQRSRHRPRRSIRPARPPPGRRQKPTTRRRPRHHRNGWPMNCSRRAPARRKPCRSVPRPRPTPPPSPSRR
ncbi:hypothetical protein ACE0DR_05020 [Azotobacter sp. CWF10]